MSAGADDKLMPMGRDAVAYATQNAAVCGAPGHHKAEFLASPERYMPQCGGFCANGISYAIPWAAGGGPNTWRIHHVNLYAAGRAAALKPRLGPGLTSRLARGVSLLYAGLHLPAHPWRR
jgi:hypothetical protein